MGRPKKIKPILPEHVFKELNDQFAITDLISDTMWTLENWQSLQYTPDRLLLVFNNSQMGQWLKQAVQLSREGSTVICVIPASTDTRWWNKWVLKAQEIRFVEGRIFKDHASAIVVFVPGAQHHYGFHAFTTCRFIKPDATETQ